MIIRALSLIFVFIVFAIYAAISKPELPEKPMSQRYQKLNSSGQPIAPWAGPWSCVLDQKTGLVWEVKNDAENIHDAYWTYSWQLNNMGVADRGDCYFEPNRCDTDDLIRRANQQQTCGIHQWRLPTKEELLTLVSHDLRPGEATIAKDFFPHTKRGDYWTSTANQPLEGAFKHLGHGAYAVNFITGEAIIIPYRNAAFVRLVAETKTEKTLSLIK
ncbi:DUF1566 domain-containing protein [Pleionea sp. CnH1-48]|uniref:Lcl C-terminal domain-containing protein n=1 Tax=Pleionea sp. CnH1-48 TaxID=2954494 RepID=UPI0020968E23|nr:DUF1566 domain-containing protein [Pleionea sp. CnH1-48]MCO7224956.1 DUF1566 domain-containing protein [Pleionea sp. CnH1-48]